MPTGRTADPDIQAEKQEKNDMKLTGKLKKQAGITNENAGKVKIKAFSQLADNELEKVSGGSGVWLCSGCHKPLDECTCDCPDCYLDFGD